MPVIRELFAKGQSVKIYPRGVSMVPTLVEGRDSVTLTAFGGKLKRFEIVLFQRTDGTYVLHRVVRMGQSYTFLGDAQQMLEGGISDKQIVAVATQICRNGRSHKLGFFSRLLGARFYFKLAIITLLRRIGGGIKRSLKHIINSVRQDK